MNKRIERLEEELGTMHRRDYKDATLYELSKDQPELYEGYVRVLAKLLLEDPRVETMEQAIELSRHQQGELPCPSWAKGTDLESLGMEEELLRLGFKTLRDGSLVSVPKKTQKVDQK